MPKVYIIILNYCGGQDTIACLESIFKLLYDNYNVILIDNYSPDDSVRTIQEWAKGVTKAKVDNSQLQFLINPSTQKPLYYRLFEEEDAELTKKQSSHCEFLTIIKAKTNRGYSAGNNIGIRYALAQNDGAFFWLLNNDTLVTPNSLNELVKCHQQYNDMLKVGIVGGKLLYYNDPNTIQCLGGATYNAYFGLIKQVGNCLPNNLENSKANEHIDYVSGACMLVKMNFIQEVGLLAEDYFFYYEELDWCTRGRDKGWNIAYTEKGVIYHKEGGAVKASSQRKTYKSEIADYYYVRNKLLYSAKYKGVIINIIIRLSLLSTIINRIIRGQFKRVFTIIKLSLKKY